MRYVYVFSVFFVIITTVFARNIGRGHIHGNYFVSQHTISSTLF